MAEALARSGPLGPAGLLLDGVGVRVSVAEPRARWLLQGAAAAQAQAAAACGLPAPVAMRAQEAAGLAMLWLGPDESLFEGAHAGLAAMPHALVDVSDRDAALDIEGAQAEILLACAILLDLHETVFPVGACARTLLGKAPALLWRRGAQNFRLLTPRSYASYARDLLAEGLRGLGPDPD